MQTIYVDVLIILNIYVNFFLLKITSGITNSHMTTKRCIIASVYGSLFSLLILCPTLNSFAVTSIKIAAAFSIVLIAFGFFCWSRFFKNTLAFFTSNFILAGVVCAVDSWLSPEFIHTENSFFYVDFSLLVLIVTTALLYFGVYLVRRFSPALSCSDSFRVTIKFKGTHLELAGLADTGNCLTDFFSGDPVIICDSIPFSFDDNNIPDGFRMIPYCTISGESVIPVFRPDMITISNCTSGETKAVKALIGIAESSGKAIFNPKLLHPTL